MGRKGPKRPTKNAAKTAPPKMAPQVMTTSLDPQPLGPPPPLMFERDRKPKEDLEVSTTVEDTLGDRTGDDESLYSHSPNSTFARACPSCQLLEAMAVNLVLRGKKEAIDAPTIREFRVICQDFGNCCGGPSHHYEEDESTTGVFWDDVPDDHKDNHVADGDEPKVEQ